MWHDTNAFNAAGIPAVSYGIAPRPEAYTRERIRSATVDDLVRLAQVYAMAAIQLCGVEGERRMTVPSTLPSGSAAPAAPDRPLR